MTRNIMSTWDDYLLINQMEISSVRITDGKAVVVGLSNKFSNELMYILFFYYWPNKLLPDFRFKALHRGSTLSVTETNQLRARVQKVLNSVLKYCN